MDLYPPLGTGLLPYTGADRLSLLWYTPLAPGLDQDLIILPRQDSLMRWQPLVFNGHMENNESLQTGNPWLLAASGGSQLNSHGYHFCLTSHILIGIYHFPERIAKPHKPFEFDCSFGDVPNKGDDCFGWPRAARLQAEEPGIGHRLGLRAESQGTSFDDCGSCRNVRSIWMSRD